MLAFAALALLPTFGTSEYFGSDVGVRLKEVPSAAKTEIVEELYAKDKAGKFRLILVSPTHPTLGAAGRVAFTNLLQGQGDGLFTSAPTFGFSEQTISGGKVTLRAKGEGYTLVKEIVVPSRGRNLRVSVRADFSTPYPAVRYLLNTYAFAPDGKTQGRYGKPDATYAPAIRPSSAGVIADHYFRAPAVVVQEGSLAASIMPKIVGTFLSLRN